MTKNSYVFTRLFFLPLPFASKNRNLSDHSMYALSFFKKKIDFEIILDL